MSTLLEETKYHPKLLLFLDLIPIPIVVEVAPDLADKETKLWITKQNKIKQSKTNQNKTKQDIS